MNTALLALRIIPGLLLMGHGLQKLVPPGYSPRLLHAAGHRGTGAGFESLGIRPAVVAAVLAGSWLGIDNWAGINWTINPAAQSAIALAIGLAGGLVVAVWSWASKRTPSHASPQAAR